MAIRPCLISISCLQARTGQWRDGREDKRARDGAFSGKRVRTSGGTCPASSS